MAINYDALPTENESSFPKLEGRYIAEIASAEMKVSKTGNNYLNLRYNITDANGKKYGSVFDMQFDSDKNFLQYKLKRFIIGFQIPISGTFELADLTKLCVGKKAYVDLKVEKQEGYDAKTVVDASAAEIYAPLEQIAPAEQTIFEAIDEEDSTPF